MINYFVIRANIYLPLQLLDYLLKILIFQIQLINLRLLFPKYFLVINGSIYDFIKSHFHKLLHNQINNYKNNMKTMVKMNMLR